MAQSYPVSASLHCFGDFGQDHRVRACPKASSWQCHQLKNDDVIPVTSLMLIKLKLLLKGGRCDDYLS